MQSVRECGQPDVPEYGDIQLVGVYQNGFSVEIVILYAIFDCAWENKVFQNQVLNNAHGGATGSCCIDQYPVAKFARWLRK